MPSIADAYVELHVDGDSLAGEVKSSVRASGAGADKESDTVGRSLGSRLGAGFLSGFSKKIKSGGGAIKNSMKDAFKGLNPRGLGITALIAAVPLLTSGVSALTGALVAFTGAVAQASVSSLAAVGVLGTLIQTKLALKVATNGLKEALAGEEGAMKALAPPAQELVKSLKSLSPEWTSLRKAVQGTTFAGIGGSIERLARAGLPTLRRGLVGTGRELNTIFKDVTKFAASEGFVRRFGAALQGNNAILRSLGRAAVPVLDGILRLFRALQPSGLRLANIIAKAGKSFQAWASAPGFAKRIDDMMKRAFKSAGNLWGILKNLGAILRNVFGAATPAGDGLLKTLNDLTSRLRAFTELASTKNAIAEWAQKGIDVTGQLFSAMGKGFMLIKGLFDPALLGGFMDAIGNMMPTITSVVSVIQGALAPVLKSIGDAFAENGPKFAALFKALGPLLKGIGSVIGEIIGQALDLLGTIAAVITPVAKVISGVLGPILTRFAPIIAAIVLAFASWGAKLVSLIPVIGRFLAPLVQLAQWLIGKIAPAFSIFGRILMGVFRGVVGAARVLFGAFRMVFTAISFVVRNAMKGIGDAVRVGWQFISGIFRGAVRIIGTVVRAGFNLIRNVVTTVFNVVRSVISGAWNFIVGVVRGAVRVVGSAVRAGFNAVKSVITSVWNGVKTITSNAWNTISSLVQRGGDKVIDFVRSIPGKIAALAGSFLNAGRDLGSKVIDGIGNGLSAVGGFVSDIGSAIKNAINSALGLPVSIKGPGPLPDFTIPAFARGTNFAPGGPAIVGERGPELVDLPRGSKVFSNADSQKMMSPSLPSNVRAVLRIGNKDFTGWLDLKIDDRIDAADSLEFQGA
jgi:phage-related protein